MKNEKGFPRPVLPKDGKNTPIPWIGGNKPILNNWAGIDPDRSELAETDKLCIVCGKGLSEDFVYMLVNDESYSNRAPRSIFDYLPSPTWVHPKCGQIAALYCPHLKRHEYPAITQNGQKLTHPELQKIAHNSAKP